MRTVVLFDGQNLYHGVRAAWAPNPPVPGSPYGYPSYDVEKLAAALVNRVPGRVLHRIRFYTGVHSAQQHAFWHGFWNNKLRYLRSRGIDVYRGRVNPGGQEKGVDVSLAIHLIQMTYHDDYDAAVVSRKVSPRGFSKGFPHPWGAAVGALPPGHVQVRKGPERPSGAAPRRARA